MATVLPRLRDDIDAVPSPVSDRPGLLLHDPLRYTEAAIVLPPLLVRCLACFDGAHTDVELRATMARLAGRDDLGDAADALVRGLSEGGFLNDQTFRSLRAERRRAFAASPLRLAAFAGGGYPSDKETLTQTLASWTSRAAGHTAVPAVAPAGGAVSAIAAPHVSPSGGLASYGAAYRALAPGPVDDVSGGKNGGVDGGDRTFVILGTSHYGRPNRFGVTRKAFQTPLGEATTDVGLVDQLTAAAPDAIDVEDYCHAIEHSIEFQVLFLQNRFGPAVRILPILCGPFGNGTAAGERPEDDDGVARVLDALAALQAAHGRRLGWVLGVDMAHVGRRYGDDCDAHVHQGMMNDVAARDRARLDRVVAGDARGFWELVHEHGPDDLKWCGSAPLYAFLRARPDVRGQILHYDQWNIDESSVVSFAALAFRGS
ncbi:MAG: AmmeMemoRadiSam system protein B [Myxococcales bacterium]